MVRHSSVDSGKSNIHEEWVQDGPSSSVATMVQAEDDVEEFKLELRTVEAAVAVVLIWCPLRVGVINGTDHGTSMDAVLDWSYVTSKDIMKTATIKSPSGNVAWNSNHFYWHRCISNTDQSVEITSCSQSLLLSVEVNDESMKVKATLEARWWISDNWYRAAGTACLFLRNHCSSWKCKLTVGQRNDTQGIVYKQKCNQLPFWLQLDARQHDSEVLAHF